MKTISLIISMLCYSIFAFSQINYFYENLNFTNCTSGYFWDQSTALTYPPDGTDYSYLTYEETTQFLSQVRKSDIDESELIVPSYPVLKTKFNECKKNNKAIPITMVEMAYQVISETAINNGLVFFLSDVLIQSNSSTNIFEDKSTFFMHLDARNYKSNKISFILNSDQYLQNHGSLPELIKMDFDDGFGWWVVNLDENININFTTTDSDKNVRAEITRNGVTKKTGFILKSSNCASQYPDPILPPWPTDNNPDRPWQISIDLEDGITNVCGNAYYLLEGDFDKPFIFVEGIDFEQNVSDLGNGDFGWCEFTSGINSDDYDYSMIARMPLLLDAVRGNGHGYDIILLDFCDGADYLENNGALLVHLIEMVNIAKVGNEPNVIAAASMGGQVSKYALDYMERNEMDHCTRLWISLDSPHVGANVPLTLQQLIYGISNIKDDPNAGNFIDEQLKRPAAMQMLNTEHVDEYPYIDNEASYPAMYNALHNPMDPNLRERIFFPPARMNWYNKMNEWGYPKNCRKVAIANGNILGHGLEHDLGPSYGYYERLLGYTCDLSDLVEGAGANTPEVVFYMAPACGDPWYNDDWGIMSTLANDISSKAVITVPFYNFHYSNSGFFNSIGNLWNDLNNSFRSHTLRKTYWVPDQTANNDYAPGGFRNSVEEFVTKINDSNALQDGGCLPMSADDYNSYHCFVPTASAFGIADVPNNENMYLWINAHPNLAHFDLYYGPSAANEPHTYISEENLDIILTEILGGEDPANGSPLLPLDFSSTINGGVFNFGKSSFTYLRGIYIHSGGHVFINRSIPFHFGDVLTEIPLINSRFKITTWSGCAASDILIDNNGRLEVGDPNGTSTAELRCKSESRITVGTDGYFIVHPGSTVIFESGSELVLQPGGHFELYDGEVIMEAGARVSYSGGSILLGGNEGRLVFDKGKLYIVPGVTFEVERSLGQHGYIEIMPNSENVLLNSANSKFQLIGLDENDMLLKINNHAHLQNSYYGNGTIVLENCKVDLNNCGGIWTDMTFRAHNVTFDASTSFKGELHLFDAMVVVDGCTFSDSKLNGHWAKIRLLDSNFSGFYAGAKVFGGYLSVDDCTFNGCNLISEALQGTTTVKNSSFIEAQFKDNSLVEVILQKCNFSDGLIYGMHKIGGILTSFCSHFEDMSVGGVAVEHANLNMNSNNRAGYNTFDYCFPPIRLIGAERVDLNDGYNVFLHFSNYCIYGTINMQCVHENNCTMYIDANHNQWGDDSGMEVNSGINYDPSETHVRTFDIPPGMCTIDGSTNNCFIEFVDHESIEGTSCPTKSDIKVKSAFHQNTNTTELSPDWTENQFMLRDLVIDPQNPLINTTSFNEIALDSALVFAAMQMESYDSLGNDQISISLFHEILLDSLDQTNSEVRRKMNWARTQMKAACENMFFDGELSSSNNQTTFEATVQQYVDVLNLMTQTELADSTYRQQFYLELDKGQLFRTIDIPEIAQQVFIHLDDCQLDSLEQLVLNQWRQQVDLEISLKEQLYMDSVSFDSLSMVVDTTHYTLPITYTSSNYYFGLWIDAPNSVTFVSCDEDPIYRDLFLSARTTSIYPNPAGDRLFIRGLKPETPFYISMTDMTGRMVMSKNCSANTTADYQLTIPQNLSDGSYVLKIHGGEIHEEHLVVVLKK